MLLLLMMLMMLMMLMGPLFTPMMMSPGSGTMLATGGMDGNIKIWKTEDGTYESYESYDVLQVVVVSFEGEGGGSVSTGRGRERGGWVGSRSRGHLFAVLHLQPSVLWHTCTLHIHKSAHLHFCTSALL